MSYRRDQQLTGPHRVVVTGAGIVTAMGHGWSANADGFRNGRVALRPITVFDTSRQRVHSGGEVIMNAPLPATKLSARQILRLDRATTLMLHAGAEAMTQAAWENTTGESIPISLGTSAGAMSLGEMYYKAKTLHPKQKRNLASLVTGYLPHTQAQLLAEAMGISGPVSIITNACASGANAIGHAFHLIKWGRARRAFCGGYDAIAEMVFAGFDSLQALSTTTPRPFDSTRDGLALGEGAAMLTLERLDDAVARGATILGEVIGYGASTDLHHLTQPHPEGEAAKRSMNLACAEAGVVPNEIDYINSHGTGTPLNDSAEGAAIQRWAGDAVSRVKVSSTKGSIGHLLGGAGAVEAVICLMAMRGGWLPPNVPVAQLDPVCYIRSRSAAARCTAELRAHQFIRFRRRECHACLEEGAMSREVIIAGWGAVSPAGWTASLLADAVIEKRSLPFIEERRVDDAPMRRFRAVPALSEHPQWLRHARLRRASPATRFAVSAAIEALAVSQLEKESLGVIFVTMNGSVTFSRRFFAEVRENPALASPILFPETVFNAPASHLSSVLASPALNYTLIGDSAQFLRGLDVAVQWLLEERVPHCLVVAAEELDWLSNEALMLFPGRRIAAEGSAAAYLKLGAVGDGIRVEQITEAFLMSGKQSRSPAAARMRAELRIASPSIVCDSRCGGDVWDAPEAGAWPDAPAHSPAQWLGDGFGISAGWQSVFACELLHRGINGAAVISAVGCSQQAIGAVIAR